MLLFSLIIFLVFFFRLLPLGISRYEMPQSLITILAINQTIHTGHYTISFGEPLIVNFFMFWHYVIPLSIENTIWVVQAMFIALTIILLYIASMELSNNRKVAALCIFLYAISTISIATQSFAVWKGESFIPTISLLSMLLLYFGYMDRFKENCRISLSLFDFRFYILSIIVLIIGIFIWAGGVYLIPLYLLIILAIMIYEKTNRKGLAIGIVLILSMLGWVWFAYSNYYSYFAPYPIVSKASLYNTTSPNGVLPLLMQGISQIQPLPNWQEVSIYEHFLIDSNQIWKLPYSIWAFSGIITGIGLALVSIYWFIKRKTKEENDILYIILISTIIISFPFVLVWNYLSCLFYLPIIILAAKGASIVWSRLWFKRLFLVCLFLSFCFTLGTTANMAQYVEMSNRYINAMWWISNNTAVNATFLSSESAGDSIFFWGNRTALIGTETAYAWNSLNDWNGFLYANAGNFSYIQKEKPDYILIDARWKEYVNQTFLERMNNTNLGILTSGRNTISSQNMTLNKVYSEDNLTIYKKS